MEGEKSSALSSKEEELLKIKLGVNWEQRNCKFCGFLKVPQKILWENERLFAFYDVNKVTAVEHILMCPKVHIRDVTFLQIEHLPLLREMEKEMLKLLNKYTPNYKYRTGYHEPPRNSENHVHLHGLTLPFNNEHLDRYVYGRELIPTHRVIDKVVSKKYKRVGAETDTPTLTEKLAASKSSTEDSRKKSENGETEVNEVPQSDEDEDILDSMLRKIMKRPEPVKNMLDNMIKKSLETRSDQESDKMLLEEMNRVAIKSVENVDVEDTKGYKVAETVQNGQAANGEAGNGTVIEPEKEGDLDDMLKNIASTPHPRIVRKGGRKNGR